ncbi:hypothetical protein [Cellulomonas chengniuliangii]|nr:hypothetical protein [Cellulomonas chengniuliangii]MCC2310076.1 hypothetical protein [Cellulomonas chengniuliangii]
MVPAARVPVIGDDFHALFETYRISNGSFLDAIVFGWNQGFLAGHLNPVGQAAGAAYHFGAFAFSSAFEISPQYYDVFFGSLFLWLTVAAAASVLTWGLRNAGVRAEVGYWRVFALVAAVTAVTVQLHPWSNDPVTSFGPAGWGSAAIGFWLLALALRSTTPGRRGWGDYVLVGVVALGAVMYYEMLVGMIAGTAVVYLGALLRARARRDSAGAWRAVGMGALGVVAPAVVFVVGRALLAIPADQSNYTGTSLSLGGDALATWWAAMVGALPGGGWPYLFSMLGGQVSLNAKSLIVALLLCGCTALLMYGWRRSSSLTPPATRSAVIPLGAVLVTWALTTATHATTVKYIDEIKVPGQVYLYYGVGVVCVAILISWGIMAWAERIPMAGRPLVLLVIGALLVTQVSLNWRLATESAMAFAPNRTLAGAAITDDGTEQARCDALAGWIERPWPTYYLTVVTTDVQENFESVFGEPFCDDPVVIARVEELVG